jgi:hypothetical protein
MRRSTGTMKPVSQSKSQNTAIPETNLVTPNLMVKRLAAEMFFFQKYATENLVTLSL